MAHQHGDLAFVAGDYARALAETERAAGLFERAGARGDLARALTSIGRIYRVHGQPEQAVPFYARALDVQQALSQGAAAVQSLLGLAIAGVVIGNAADAEDILRDTLLRAMERLDLTAPRAQLVEEAPPLVRALAEEAGLSVELGERCVTITLRLLEHPVLDQVRGQLADLLVNLCIGVALVFVDEVVLVALQCGGLPQRPHGGRHGGEGLQRNPTHFDGGGGEGRTRGVEFRSGGEVVVNHGVDHCRSGVSCAT